MLSYLILYLKKCALLLQLGALALCTLIRDLRAPTADVGYVPNAKYLAHIPHQTKFIPFIRCAKSHIFCNMLQYNHKFATVR